MASSRRWLSAWVTALDRTESGRADRRAQSAIADVQASGQLHVDETLWLEGRQTTWLWVFTAATVTLYAIAGRGRAIHESLTDSGQQSDFSSASQIFLRLPRALLSWTISPSLFFDQDFIIIIY